jgi:8-hydroxy-5-deazaflavin:NADPH oxidoreductase
MWRRDEDRNHRSGQHWIGACWALPQTPAYRTDRKLTRPGDAFPSRSEDWRNSRRYLGGSEGGGSARHHNSHEKRALLSKEVLSHLSATSPIVDTGNYYPLRDGAIAEIKGGMTESEWTSRVLGRPVIKAFNNVVADSLLHKVLPKGSKNRIALPVSGDDVRSKQFVMALLDEIGFDSIDAGPLSESWRYQPGTPAYCTDPTIQQLPLLLRRARRDKAAGNRDRAAKLMAKLPSDFPPQELVRVARLSAGLDTLKPRSWIAVLRLGFAAIRKS